MRARSKWAAAAAAAALLTCAAWAFAEGNPFSAVRVGASRSTYTGPCPATIHFTGNIDYVMPHPKGFVYHYHWERSDGNRSKVVVVRPDAGQRRLVVHDSWQLGERGKRSDVSVTLVVDSGNTHESASSRTVSISCT